MDNTHLCKCVLSKLDPVSFANIRVKQCIYIIMVVQVHLEVDASTPTVYTFIFVSCSHSAMMVFCLHTSNANMSVLCKKQYIFVKLRGRADNLIPRLPCTNENRNCFSYWLHGNERKRLPSWTLKYMYSVPNP